MGIAFPNDLHNHQVPEASKWCVCSYHDWRSSLNRSTNDMLEAESRRASFGYSNKKTDSLAQARHHRDLLAAVEASMAAVLCARQAANESLRRAQAAPEAHETSNTIFVFLYEEHLRDR